ncbi:spermine/spermidine synthase domain-containing protein [Methylomagnum sp.]
MQTTTTTKRPLGLEKFNALSFLLLLSGFAGISYEVLYGRLLGNLIGDQFAVSASVLITFLLGSGLGSAFAHRLWRWLWLIEAGIGACGVAFAFGHETLQGLLYSGAITAASGLGVQVLVGVALLLLPAFLVGCSVPLFSGYLANESDDAGFAGVYAIYNLGAGLTAVALEFLVLRAFGITGAMLCFVTINFVVAAWLRWRYADLPPPRAEGIETQRFPLNEVAALALASMASAIFQLFMIKLAEFMFGPFRETFALVLAIVLFGIAIGTGLVKRFRIGFSGLMAANLLGLGLLLALVKPAIYAYSHAYEAAVDTYGAVTSLKTAVLLVLMTIPAITFGATVPALLTRSGHVAKESGFLLFVAAVANSAGFLVMVFVIHQYLDYGVQLLTVAGLSGAALLMYRGVETREIEAAVAGAAMLFGVHHWLWDETLLFMNYVTFQSHQELVSAREDFRVTEQFRGHQDIFSITWIDDKPYFFINGYVSFPLNSSSEQVVGLVSSQFAPRIDDALVLGLGSGSTASVVALAFDHTDAVEINPAVVANLGKMSQWNHDLLDNKKLNIVLDDGIHYVRSAKKTYSLVLNTVTSPIYFSSAKLYTHDFYQAIKKRLKPDGIYATWVDSRIGDGGVDIILKTLSASFKECSAFYIKSTYFLFVCGDQPVSLRQVGLEERAPQVWQELSRKYLIVPEWIPYHLLSAHAFKLLNDPDSVPVNTLDFPVLEFEIAKLKRKGIPRFKTALEQRISLDELRRPLAALGGLRPARLVVEAEQRLDDDAYITLAWKKAIEAGQESHEREYAATRLEYWQRLAKLAGTAKAHHKYGFQLLEQQRYDEAIAEFKSALAIDEHFDNAYYNIAAAYEFKKDYAQAVENYSRELAIDPEDHEAVYRIGRDYVELGDYEKGLFYLTAQNRKFDGARGGLYHARALDGLGRRSEAVEQYQKALKNDSADPAIAEDARQRLTKLMAGG